MILGPEDLDQIRALLLPKLVRVMFVQTIAIVVLSLVVIAVFHSSARKRPEVLAVTESGRIIPLVPLDQPFETNGSARASSTPAEPKPR